MENELIKRYIYAVTRYLPPKMQDDVEKELDSLILDMLAERCGGAPTESDVKAVLIELGAPAELAAKYLGDENQSLISGVYFLWYKRILKIVIPIVAAAVAFASILALCLDWPTQLNPAYLFGEVFGRTIGGAVGGALNAFVVITIVFAAMERSKTNINKFDFISSLPPVPNRNEQIKPYKPIISILWSLLAVAIFLAIPCSPSYGV